jgi:predicted metal-dependent enzyme (double-stranded beta helix superfamily)
MFDLDTFVADCRAVLREATPEAAVRELAERAVAQPAEVERALGTPSSGGVTTLHRSPELTILNVVWTPGMAVYPHDHRMWAVIALYGGREDNTFYRRSPEGLVVAGNKKLEIRDAALLGKNVVHAVANPLRSFTGAIHLYGGDFFATPRSEWSGDLSDERPYDVEAIKRVFAEANERWRAECVAGHRVDG